MSFSKPTAGLHAIAYVSSAVERLAPAQIDAILFDSRQRNQSEAVTGALLYHDGSFFQYLEGPGDGLARIYSRIKGSHFHVGLIELLDQPVSERIFPDWLMGFSEAPRSVLQSLQDARWMVAVDDLKKLDDPPDGVCLLLDFWNRSSRHKC